MTRDSTWTTLGTVAPDRLVETRVQLHWAAQIPMAAADAHLETRPDDSQANLGWSRGLGGLIGHPLPGGLRSGIRFASPAWVVVDEAGGVVTERPIHGRTLDEGLQWMSSAVASGGGGPSLRFRDYDMPPHDVAAGAPFSLADAAPAEELARWYANAEGALAAVAAEHEHASQVRCWPHHFDIATLITLDPGVDPEHARSIGVGLSPGDQSYAAPYVYVTPYPVTAPPATPPSLAGGGRWHREGWFGAVLPASALLDGPGDTQSDRLRGFLASAIRADHDLLTTKA